MASVLKNPGAIPVDWVAFQPGMLCDGQLRGLAFDASFLMLFESSFEASLGLTTAAPICGVFFKSIIGASLSEPHSSEDNAEVVCLSVMDRHGPRFDVFSFDDSYL